MYRFLKKTMFAVFLAFFLSVNPVIASADFIGDFSPSKWSYQESDSSNNGPVGSLTESEMKLISADWPTGALQNTVGSYAITIPWYLQSISFDYSYVSQDRDNSSYDMPSYVLNGNLSMMRLLMK